MDEILSAPGKPVFPGLHDGGHVQGLPLGGFGTGGIGRDYYGGFSRWTVKAGCVKQFCEPGNLFAAWQAVAGQDGVARILYPDPAPESIHGAPGLPGWRRDYPAAAASYHALFPKAWYHYRALPDMPVELICEQFSPVLPGRYREASLPVGVFVWHARNTGDRPVSLSLLFSFTNMVGWFNDFAAGRPLANRGGGLFNRPVNLPLEVPGQSLAGVLFDRRHAGAIPDEGDGQMCIAARMEPGVTVTRHVGCQVGYMPAGKDPWESFAAGGRLADETPSHYCGSGTDLVGALAVSVELRPGECREIPMALAWDLPVVRFGSGRRHFRHYTKHAGADGRNAAALAAEALTSYRDWSRQIDDWHGSVIARGNRPDWYYAMLFNELYLMVDGFTMWTAGEVEGSSEEHFGIIECPDYPLYNTTDLWVYGSFALLYYWPEIEKLVARRLARFVHTDDPRPRLWLWKRDERYPNKVPGAVPHDFGCPLEDPFIDCNAYNWQNPNVWRDLNAQFVLIVARDYSATRDQELLEECWPAVKAAMARLATFDADGDGLIENTGAPDQTFDCIPLLGPGAYCNSLWLGALGSARNLAKAMNDGPAAEEFAQRLDAARHAFDSVLWNGTHYRTDTAGSHKDTVFLEQLFGVWYAGLLGVEGLVPEEKALLSTRTAYESNFLAHLDGRIGAMLFTGVAGTCDDRPTTKYNPEDCQSHEALCGINLAFACHLAHVGMEKEAFTLLEAVYRIVYQEKGLWFRTPAAWNAAGDFRAIMNLRPLVIWAMEYSHEGTSGRLGAEFLTERLGDLGDKK